MMRKLAVVALVMMGLAGTATASERQFTYTYDTNVLSPGEKELEPWTTMRVGREGFYTRFDNRLEFEMGVIENLQTAWYINFDAISAGTGADRVDLFSFKGVSWEWKYKLMDSVADPIGLGLYGELSAGPAEYEVEAKVLLDKRIGNVLLATNLIGEYEWEFAPEGLVRELIFQVVGGVSYLTDFGLALGIEFMNHNEFVAGTYEHSALYVGPTVSYKTKAWWFAMTVMPQVGAPHGATGGTGFVLDEHERVNARVLFGWHL